jgi:LysR family transcriptional regulator (chromosome initiation inhibitor)
MQLDQLRALSTTVAEGSLEAAARVLHVTPSAVSQRLRALESTVGRVLLVRGRPARVTEAGEAVLRLARQVETLVADTAAELGADRAPVLPLAVNADSLATWFLPALAPLAGEVAFDLHRADQAVTSGLLRDGTVVAAVTADAEPVAGCRTVRLGAMRYRPAASAAFAARWFPEGPDRTALERAPLVVFDRTDDLQDAFLRHRGVDPALPPRHHVPASADFAVAVGLGLGWGMLPDLQRDGVPVEPVELVELVELGGPVDVGLHWQQWRLRSASLDRVADAVVVAARRALLP